MQPETNAPKSMGEKMQSVPKWVLYLILFVATTVPLFFEIPVPNKPVPASIDLFAGLMKLPDGCSIIIGSDWTNSTRGESMGEMDSLLRILMRKNIKFAIYSTADPQAPQVAIDSMDRLNAERKKSGEKEYVRFRDWVSLGYFSNSEGENQAIGSDVRKAFAGRKDVEPGHPPQDVFDSPVLKNIHKTADFPALVLISASSTDTITIERIYGKGVPIAMMVTGVMVPQEQVYYQSGQLFGMCGGLKGVYDLETMMEYGVNVPGPDGKIVVEDDRYGQIPGFKGAVNKGKATLYYPTLHAALTLLILAVFVGNLGMFLSRKRAS